MTSSTSICSSIFKVEPFSVIAKERTPAVAAGTLIFGVTRHITGLVTVNTGIAAPQIVGINGRRVTGCTNPWGRDHVAQGGPSFSAGELGTEYY